MTMSLLGASSDEVAAYQLGRQASEVEATNRRALRTLFGPRTPDVDVNAVVAQNHALAAENAHLKLLLEAVRRDFSECEQAYAKLDAWADIAAKKLKQHGL